MNQGSTTPATMIFHHQISEYLSAGRAWQGIPAITRTDSGRLYAAWYSGAYGEVAGNVVIIEVSDDDGATWTEGWCVIKHDDPLVRCFDPALWMENGTLYLTWTQSAAYGRFYFDGRGGTFFTCTENPEADTPAFAPARRIANGIMMNKPTIASDGTWYLCNSLWDDQFEPTESHPELADEMLANVYASTDGGMTFTRRGGVNIPGRTHDEHMIVEKNDGSLWMLIRTKYGIGQATSRDGGFTWTDVGPSGHTGPNSRFFIRRLRSGHLLLINHVNPTYLTFPHAWNRRDNLMAMISTDDGVTWQGGLMLDAREGVSYPDGVEGPDGTIYIIYDYDRYGQKDILLCTFTEEDVLTGRPISDKARFEVLINRATGQR